MGFLKKITRPISRVLDKVIPNEIKPALPFLAAAAPFMAPGIMGAFGNSMLSRGLISGGLNLGSQLAQEGSDGDFSGLSTLMAAATGALSTPSATKTMSPGGQDLFKVEQSGAADFFKNKAAGMEPGFAKSGLGALEGTSNYLSGVSDTLQNELFSKAGLKAALVPVGQGITDLAVAENRRAMKDYEREQADYEKKLDEEDANRAFAIRQSMEAYGFTEQEILDAIEAAGYRAGGRVGFDNGGDVSDGKRLLFNKKYVELLKEYSEAGLSDADSRALKEANEFIRELDFAKGGRVGLKGGGADFGGIPAAIQNIKEDEEETITIMTDNGPMEIEKSVYESMPGMFMDTTTSAYGDAGRGRPVPEFADGGLMNLGGKEMDLRKGGFVPIGKKEKADDVPARLSKNEFVMTADAVRAAGGGSVNKGAKRMYDLMNNLEAKV
jgi:hypothetical protein